MTDKEFSELEKANLLPKPDCEICDDTSLVETNDVQGPGAIIAGTKIKCICQLQKHE